MQDPFGRTIDYLRLSVTDRCNLRCRYCMPEEGVASLSHEQILSLEEMLHLSRIATELGVRKIRVTGGEPLVRKGLLGFIAGLKALPNRPEVALTTNGVLLPGMARRLKDAGLDRVNISLDSLRSERFESITRRGGLEKVLAGIDAALNVGLTPVKLNMVPILGVNADEIEAFARLSLTRPLEVRFIEFMPVSASVGYTPRQRLGAEGIYRELERVGELRPELRRDAPGPARLYRYAGALGTVGVIPAVSEHFCAECNRLRITSDGQVRPCLFSNSEIDLRGALRQGATDAELKERMLEAVCAKPQKHQVGEAAFQPASRSMHGIGG